MHFNLELEINANKVTEEIDTDNAFWLYIATRWWELYTPYVPMRDGYLYGTVDFSKLRVIEHTQNYSQRMYEGEGFNFSKRKHELATAYWDEAAKRAGKLDVLQRDAQKYIDKGRLKLG